MLLCLDVGNSHIYGGVFSGKELILQFRYPSCGQCTSDQLGVFFRSILRENSLKYQQISKIIICSVVPSLDYSLRSSIVKYFGLEPSFLRPNNDYNFKIHCENPLELGADRLATSIGAANLFPHKNLIVIDLGTATTFEAISKQREYQGGLIIAGLNLQMKALTENTAKLPPVNIIKPNNVIGNNTICNIQAGLYYGHLGAMITVIDNITKEQFNDEAPFIIGTGGFAHLFEHAQLFDIIVPDLVLQGLHFVSTITA